MLCASVTARGLPLLSPGSQSGSQIKRNGCCARVRNSTGIKPKRLDLQLQPTVGRSRKQSSSFICAAAAAWNVTFSADGQIPITQAPVRGSQSEFQIKCRSQPTVGRIRKKTSSVICAAAPWNATCSASGQTQTITREAPTITQAPVHAKEKSPQLDDGDSGFPPRDDDGGGGGGGGGGGNWSGGFFLFGFLAFLGFLKDKESEEDYRDSRRRR